MAYSEKALERAKLALKKREQNAEDELLKHQETAFKKCPQLIEIKAKMAESSLSVIKVMLSGGDASDKVAEIARENLALQKLKKELLLQNGFSEDYLKPHFVCEKCSDTGYVDGRMCSCHKELLKKISLDILSETAAINECSFENFRFDVYPNTVDPKTGISPRRRMEEIFNYCKCYAEDFGKDSDGIFMYGETGLGKTHLSLAIASVVAKSGYSVVYGSAPNLLSKLENERFNREYESSGTENELLSCDLLIIDDLGSEFSTQFTVAEIYNILNTRITYKKPFIINTNLTSQELQAKYSERITSRIIGSCESLRFFGRDVRQIKRSEL